VEPLVDGAAGEDATSPESREPGDPLDAGCGLFDAGGCGWFCGYGFRATVCGAVGLLFEGDTGVPDFEIAGNDDAGGGDAGEPTMSFQLPPGTIGELFAYVTAPPVPGIYTNSGKDNCSDSINVTVGNVPEAILSRAKVLECSPETDPCAIDYYAYGATGCAEPLGVPRPEGSWTLTLTAIDPFDVDTGMAVAHGNLRAQLNGGFAGGILVDAGVGSTTLFLPF
jgi:hypothetical protein